MNAGGRKLDPPTQARVGTQLAVFYTLRAMDAPLPGVIPATTGPLTRTIPARPLDGLNAARLVADAGRGMLVEFAATARGAGSSWLDLANAIGLNPEPIEPGMSSEARDEQRADAAFVYVTVEPIPGPQVDALDDELTFTWTCSTCRRAVTDYGPYADRSELETGHAEGCARDQAATPQTEGSDQK